MDSFEPGEIAIVHNMNGELMAYNNTECDVMSALQTAENPKDGQMYTGYIVRLCDGRGMFILQDRLKKRPPPGLPGDPLQTPDWDIISGPRLIKLATT